MRIITCRETSAGCISTFLGIYSNNLDEFFRVRVATQSRVAECEDKSAKKEQEEAKKLLKQIYKLNSKYAKEYEQTITALNRELRDNNIYLLRDNEVDDEQRAFIRDYYYQKLNGFWSCRSASAAASPSCPPARGATT